MSEAGQDKIINSYHSLASVSEGQEGLVGTGACALSEAECVLLGMGTQCHQIFRFSDFLSGARSTGFYVIATDFFTLTPLVKKILRGPSAAHPRAKFSPLRLQCSASAWPAAEV